MKALVLTGLRSISWALQILAGGMIGGRYPSALA